MTISLQAHTKTPSNLKFGDKKVAKQFLGGEHARPVFFAGFRIADIIHKCSLQKLSMM
jgi:hypothetical protein